MKDINLKILKPEQILKLNFNELLEYKHKVKELANSDEDVKIGYYDSEYTMKRANLIEYIFNLNLCEYRLDEMILEQNQKLITEFKLETISKYNNLNCRYCNNKFEFIYGTHSSFIFIKLQCKCGVEINLIIDMKFKFITHLYVAQAIEIARCNLKKFFG